MVLFTKRIRNLFFLILITNFLVLESFSQTVINGKILDQETNEELIGASVKIISSNYGCITDFNGGFIIKTNIPLPFNIEVSYIGYESKTIDLNNEKFLKIKLESKDLQLKAVEVVSGISKKLKESPLSIETMDINDIKQTSATNFYEGLSHMKGVDMTSASLGFRVINTRGFNSTSPVRSLQIIDGVDNASPGLNFALGNFLGASELDLMKVEIISGASSAFYGPNAFNGVISMETKNPFLFPGFSASIKLGERNLNEYAVRYAKVLKDKKGKDRFAYKLNFFYMNANDWEAINSNSVEGLDTDESNPGGYDAVNRYGDENLSPLQNNTLFTANGEIDLESRWQYPGLGIYHRTGYWEKDIVDYKTENLKAAASFHYKINEDLEISLSSNFGTGTTVYQGDNRFSLKDILFFQNKIELKKENNFFIRAYSTHEDAGNSYDAVLTSFIMQDAAAENGRWSELYQNSWQQYGYDDKVRALDPNVQWKPAFGVPVDYQGMEAVYAMFPDSLAKWHQECAAFANSQWNQTSPTTLDFFEPGTARFDSLKNEVISGASFVDGGSKIVDKSSLYHFHAEKIFNADFGKITLGSNSRVYTPKSNGSLFSDTNNIKIVNVEGGVYGGFEKKLLSNQLIFKSSLRVDKNQNFDLLPSSSFSFIFNANEKTTLRTTFTSAIRNPTLLNQYMYYDVGRAILAGNITGYDSLITTDSYIDFLINEKDPIKLSYFNVAPIRPEQVKTFEFGVRSNIKKSIYVDFNYYYSWYRDFIGFINGISGNLIGTSNGGFTNWELEGPNGEKKPQAYRIAINSRESITTQGAAIGINYYLNKNIELNGNYSWNILNKKSDDPIIPSYNTPRHKYNIGITGRNINLKIAKLKNIGFNINYKWIEGFLFEGSPQFTGNIPTYGLLDIQINKTFKKQNLTLKLGSSNALNNKIIQVYGGPYVGRMTYFSLTFDLKDS